MRDFSEMPTGKRIAAISLSDDEQNNKLRIVFADGTALVIADEGWDCCERRYMRTDDDLSHFIGAELRGAEIRPAPDVQDPHGETHEVEFLVIHTDRGDFTMSSHNEHNGYYGGFRVQWMLES